MDIYDIRTALHSGKSIYDLPLRVTYYARVSTDKDEQIHSLTAQVRYYTEYIQRNPQWIFVEGYVDEGISGTTVGKRENFLKMVQDAEAGHFDFILTKEISRFSRNTLDSIKYTQDLLRFGVGVLFESDNINTLMPDAELRLTIMSSIAQDEVRKISERVKFGFKRAIEKGTVLGNSRIWGYEKRDGALVIQEEEAEMVRLLFDLYANQRMGIRSVAGELAARGYRGSGGKPLSFSTIRGILSNPKYKGYYCGGKSCKYDYKLHQRKFLPPEEWVLYKDGETVPPIVSEELWDKANALLAQRGRARRAPSPTGGQSRYPYSGKIFCPEHGTPYHRAVYHYASGDKEVWQCQEYARKGKKGCAMPVLYTAELDELARRALDWLGVEREELVGVLLALYALARKKRPGAERLAKCRKAIEEVRRRKDRLLDLNIEGRITDAEFAQRNEGFNRELAELEARRAALEEERDRESGEGGADLEGSVRRAFAFEEGFCPGVLDELVERVEPTHGDSSREVEVHLHLKPGGAELAFRVHRRRGEASLCTGPYT